jgi:hypothetical protein
MALEADLQKWKKLVVLKQCPRLFKKALQKKGTRSYSFSRFKRSWVFQ